jgi:ATP-binding cassette, subfamily F, member 3
MADKLLLQVRGISKAFGEKHILTDASVSINEKQKIGVIGRNGAGKTTFFKILMGKLEADSGEIVKMPTLRLGYIEQHDQFLPNEKVLEFLERYTGKPEWECAKVAGQFDLKNEKLTGKITDLSGGYQMRVKLTATLLFEPNLLLLDEPTNYLDLSTLILLENFLLSFRGSVMVITHDREFIKKTCTSILDVDHQQLIFHPEPLEEYLEFKAEQKALAAKVNVNVERKQKQLQTFVDRFGAKASMAKSAQSKLKQIDKLEGKKIGIKQAFSTVRMLIPEIEPKSGFALEVKNLNIGYDQKIIAQNINFEVERGKKVAILGDNGQGKSTLLKTIVGIIKPISGKCDWKSGLKISYYNQHVANDMNPKDTVINYIKNITKDQEDIKDELIFRVLANFLFKRNDYQKTISVLSGGEKARLCLAGMFLTKADVYLLDEPTNHLDFETVEAMGTALGEFNGTVFVVSHNRTFVNLIANEIMEVKNGLVKRVLGSYEDYVWQLEEEAKQINPKNATSSEISDPFSENSSKNLSKENRKKAYNLRKESNKVEQKIKKLQELIQSETEIEKNQTLIKDLEIRWLEIQTELNKLN